MPISSSDKYNTRINSPVIKHDDHQYKSINQIPVDDVATRHRAGLNSDYVNGRTNWQPADVNTVNAAAGSDADNLPPPRTGARVRDDFVLLTPPPKMESPSVNAPPVSTQVPPVPILEAHCSSSIYR